MSRNKNSITLFLLIAALTVTATSAIAQRKKKGSEFGQITEVKLREAEFYFTEGERYFILEDYTKAIDYYGRSLEIDPENATVYYKLAEVFSQGQKQDDMLKASANIEKALTLEKKNKYFYLLAARIYSNLTQFDKAATMYETMLKEVKDTENYLYELGAIYQYANQPDNAIKIYNRAEAFFGINEIASLQKLRIYFEQGKNEEGFREGEKLVNAFPEEEQFIVGFAETLSQFGFKERGTQALEKFLEANPLAPNVSMLLAGLYRDTNQEVKARELLLTIFANPEVELSSKLIVLGTYNAELNQNKERGQRDPEKEKFGLQLFSRLEKDFPDQANVQVIGGDLYLSIGKNAEAQKHYLLAIDAGATSFEVWQNLLYLEMQLEQFDNVIIHAERALEYFPNQAMLHYFNGIANLRKRKNKPAAESLEQAKRLSGANPTMAAEINGLLGDTYNALKEYEKSDRAYDDALAFNSSNDAILNNYSYFLAIRKSNLEKAERMASLLVKNNPENATYLDTYAWVLYVREKYKEAKKVIEKAVATGMASAAHIEHYGDILFKLGDVENAVKQWERAKSMLTTSNEILNKKIANRKVYE